MISEQVNTEIITLTPNAVKSIRQLMEDRKLEGYALRVFVSGGGCSGIQYGMALEDNIREMDQVSEFDGVKVVVDEVSINYLQGSIVDYIESKEESGFKIINPNPLASCGCSSSSQDEFGGCSGCG